MRSVTSLRSIQPIPPLRYALAVLLFVAACGGTDPGDDGGLARRSAALRLIHRLDEPSVLERVVEIGEVEPLVAASRPEYPPSVRQAACAGLARLDDPAARTRLEHVAEQDPDESVRRFARAALAGHDVADIQRRDQDLAEAKRLAGLLDRPEARAAAARLGVVEPIASAARKGPHRTWACWVLADMSQPAAENALVAVQDDPNPRVRYHARAALTLRHQPDDEDRIRKALAERERIEKEAEPFAPMLANPAARDAVVKLGAVWTLVEATHEDRPAAVRRQACLGLGLVGGDDARRRLLDILAAETPDPVQAGAVVLYAAVALTQRKDPGTAIDLLLALSTVNPNNNIAALAAEGTSQPYYTVDAQICDALLHLGLFEAEEELVAQMKRRDYVRVLIDAHAVLRRHTELDLPFFYNGSYEVRDRQADAWQAASRKTRAARVKARPFDDKDPRFRERLGDMLGWLRGKSVNDRYIAEKLLLRLGPYAVEPLLAELTSDDKIAQRQAALMLGRIGDARAAPGLREMVDSPDPDARARCLEALWILRDRDAAPVAISRLSDEDPEVRAQAATLLGGLGVATARAPLRTALARETLPATRTALRCALAQLGEDDVLPALLEAFVSGDQREREAAADALGARAKEPLEAGPLDPEPRRRAAAAAFRKK